MFGLLFAKLYYKLKHTKTMNGWDVAIIMIIGGYFLYPCMHIAECFVKTKRLQQKSRIKIVSLK